MLALLWTPALAQGPVTHFILIVQENRTFDEYFGHFPGVQGYPVTTAKSNVHRCADTYSTCVSNSDCNVTADPGDTCGTQINLQECDPTQVELVAPHDHFYSVADVDAGAMDGFPYLGCKISSATGCPINYTSSRYVAGAAPCTSTSDLCIPTAATCYYLPKDIHPYDGWAQRYALADNFFSSQSGPSNPGHKYIFSAGSNETIFNPQAGGTDSWTCYSNAYNGATGVGTEPGPTGCNGGTKPCVYIDNTSVGGTKQFFPVNATGMTGTIANFTTTNPWLNTMVIGGTIVGSGFTTYTGYNNVWKITALSNNLLTGSYTMQATAVTGTPSGLGADSSGSLYSYGVNGAVSLSGSPGNGYISGVCGGVVTSTAGGGTLGQFCDNSNSTTCPTSSGGYTTDSTCTATSPMGSCNVANIGCTITYAGVASSCSASGTSTSCQVHRVLQGASGGICDPPTVVTIADVLNQSCSQIGNSCGGNSQFPWKWYGGYLGHTSLWSAPLYYQNLAFQGTSSISSYGPLSSTVVSLNQFFTDVANCTASSCNFPAVSWISPDNNPGIPILNPSGTATFGTTSMTGTSFNTSGLWNSATVTTSHGSCTISSVSSTTNLTLTSGGSCGSGVLSYTISVDTSEHNNGPYQGGVYTSAIMDAIFGNPTLYGSTVVCITWDDFGGRYDHVAPPTLDNIGLGMRVPLICLGPYVQQGINHSQMEFASILRYIEDTFMPPANQSTGWQPHLTCRDLYASETYIPAGCGGGSGTGVLQNSIGVMVNTSQTPIPPPPTAAGSQPFAKWRAPRQGKPEPDLVTMIANLLHLHEKREAEDELANEIPGLALRGCADGYKLGRAYFHGQLLDMCKNDEGRVLFVGEEPEDLNEKPGKED